MTFVPEIAHPVNARDWKGVNQREDVMTYVAVRTAQTSANGWGVDESGTSYTLDGTQGQAVAFDYQNSSVGEIVGTLHDQTGRGNMGGSGFGAQIGAAVRRLTPTECCRLQGFPDDWFEGNDKSDGPMYRALGNAVTVPVLEWIGRRIMRSEAAALEGGA
jgi:DNA (cytosine-5)-methyltransferase 1